MSKSARKGGLVQTARTHVLSLHRPLRLFAFSCQMTAMVLLILTWSIPATAVTTPDSRCSTDSGLVVDQSSCKSFIICFKGKARTLTCSRDLLFNADRLTCDFPSNVQCGNRAKDAGGGTCYSAMINVTVKIQNEVREPKFKVERTLQAPRQPLRYILLIASGLDQRFRYETQHFEGYGDYLSSINGLSNDVKNNLAVWQPYNKKRQLIANNIDDYVPENNDVITYIYTDALGG